MATDESGHGEPRQSARFMALFALAWAGGAVAYVPFLTLLLPARIAGIAGDNAVQWLGYMAFFGALSASLGGIIFGWLSDVTHNRRGWISAGLVVNVALMLVMSRIETQLPLLTTLILWQLGLNMMLGPLSALAGDFIPDRQKGMLGGLLAFAPAAGAAAGAVVTIPGLAPGEGRFVIVATLVAACVLPLLLAGKPRPFPELMVPTSKDDGEPTGSDRAIVRMWIARLAVQLAEAALFVYLLYYFRSIDPSIRDADTARIFSFTLVLAIPLTLFVGRWADRKDRAILPLKLMAGLSAAGLAIMAVSNGLIAAIAGYVLFGLATTVFLSLHSSLTLRVLPRPQTRGRDLGLFNLTNTFPSLIMPWLAIAIVPGFGYGPLIGLLAGLALLACVLLSTIRMLPKTV